MNNPKTFNAYSPVTPGAHVAVAGRLFSSPTHPSTHPARAAVCTGSIVLIASIGVATSAVVKFTFQQNPSIIKCMDPKTADSPFLKPDSQIITFPPDPPNAPLFPGGLAGGPIGAKGAIAPPFNNGSVDYNPDWNCAQIIDFLAPRTRPNSTCTILPSDPTAACCAYQ